MEFYYLKKVQSNEKQIIPFKKNEIIIGRGKDCTYQIIDPSISRNHALIKKYNNEWILKNLSSNELYINNNSLKENEEISLQTGNIIRFGHTEKYCFRLGMKAKGKEEINKENYGSEQKKLERKYSDVIHAKQIENEILSKRLKELLEENESKHQQVIEDLETKLKAEEERKLAILKDKDELSVKLQIEKINLERRLMQERKDLENRLVEEKKQLQNHLLKVEEERIKLEQDSKYKENFLQLKEKEKEEMYEKHLQEYKHLKSEKEELSKRLTEVETDLEEKVLLTATLEGELKEKQKIDEHLEALLTEKRILESNLKDAIERGAQVSHLEESLMMLEAQKLSLEQEVASVTSVSKTARKEVLESVSDVLENEFQCPICSELFITAVTLGCSHTFCKHCIDSWKKNKLDCPNCRKTITSEIRSLIVDNFIEKIVHTLSEDMKKQRNEVIAERQAEINAATTNAQRSSTTNNQEVQVVASSFRRGRGRGGRQNRGGRGRGRQQTPRNAQPSTSAANYINPNTRITNNTTASAATSSTSSATAEIVPVTISSDSDSSDSNSDNSYDSETSEESGYSGAYYGGYGRCFNCGRRGHWTTGCPYS